MAKRNARFARALNRHFVSEQTFHQEHVRRTGDAFAGGRRVGGKQGFGNDSLHCASPLQNTYAFLVSATPELGSNQTVVLVGILEKLE